MPMNEAAPFNRWVYDILLWIFSVIVEIFFREIHPRGSWKVPKDGPVLFVCAPHANQFVDPLLVMRCAKIEFNRRIHVLIAEASMKRKFVGFAAGAMGAVPVGRAQDVVKPATGKIYLPDPINDPLLLRGVGTNFEASPFQVGGSVYLPKVNGIAASCEIGEIKGPEELRLKRPFKGGVALQQLTGRNDMTEKGTFVGEAAKRNGTAEGFEGINFSIAPKLDQKEVYDKVSDVFFEGGSIGIFPEGGSHDRTELLPLKAGVAIMSLGALAEKRDCKLKIVPVGMNYFHPHKFRSRAVIEFGTAIDIPMEYVDQYVGGQRREAIGNTLEMIKQALATVTVQTPEPETLMLIQAVRRLYNPKGKNLPLSRVVELNRRLVKGYERYKDDPRIVELRKEVVAYNKRLFDVGIRDHQVQYSNLHIFWAFTIFWYRLIKLVLLSALVIPGTLLFSLVFIFTKVISMKKAKQALAASNVKVEAKDVVATWKIMVAMVVTPLSYGFHISWVTFFYWYNNFWGYAPPGYPIWLVMVAQVFIYPIVTYAALRFGEVGMDILKSLWPLMKMMIPSSNNEIHKLKIRREELVDRVNNIINILGPEMFEDFDSKRIIEDPFVHSPPQTPDASRRSKSGDFTHSPEAERPGSSHIPRNESFNDLANQDFFSTRPPTPKKGRSRTPSSGGFQLKAFSTLDQQDSLNEVSKKIRGAMRERNVRRRSSGAEGWQIGSGASTPTSEEGDGIPDGLTMTKKRA